MSLEEFVKSTISDNKKYVEEVIKLQEILDNLGKGQRNPRIYAISITSNT